MDGRVRKRKDGLNEARGVFLAPYPFALLPICMIADL